MKRSMNALKRKRKGTVIAFCNDIKPCAMFCLCMYLGVTLFLAIVEACIAINFAG